MLLTGGVARAFSFCNNENQADDLEDGKQLEYRIIGIDDKWHDLSDSNEITYNELPYGRHVVQLRSDEVGAGDVDTVSLRIRVLPPLWLSWWAQLIYVTVFFALIWFITRRHSKDQVSAPSYVEVDPESKSEEQKQFKESLVKIDMEFLDKLDRAIADNLSSEKVNVDYLSDYMCMSRATLYRKIKSITGMSSNEYIRKVRMHKAKEYLLAGNMSVSEVSDKVGCSSPAYFRESFKAVFGMSPSDYVKSLKNGL